MAARGSKPTSTANESQFNSRNNNNLMKATNKTNKTNHALCGPSNTPTAEAKQHSIYSRNKSHLKAAAAAFYLVIASVQSHAAIVDFTLTNTVNGENILGRIFGIEDILGPQSATQVWIDSYFNNTGTGFPATHTVPYNWGAGGSFTVSGNAVTAATFSSYRAGNPATSFDFNYVAQTFNMQSFNNGAVINGTSVVFGPVPEPTSALLLLGSGAMLLLRRRRPVV